MKTLKKRIAIGFGLLFGGLLGVLLLAVVLLQWNVDALANRLLKVANQNFQGEIVLDEVELRLLRFLPNVTLQLTDVSLREEPGNPDSEVLNADRLLVAINPFKLLSNELSLSAIELDSGFARLIVFPDSTTNLANALTLTNPADTLDKDKTKKKTDQEPLGIQVKRLIIQNFELLAENQLSGLSLRSTLTRLEDKMVYSKRMIDNQLGIDLYLNSLSDSTGILLADQSLGLESDLFLDRTQKLIRIEQCLLSLNGAGIQVEGTYDLEKQGYADLEFFTQNVDLNLFSLLTNQLLDLPEERFTLDGQIELMGKVKGQTLGNTLPYIEFNFQAINIQLFDKEQKEQLLQNLSTRIFFTTGHKQNLEDLIIEIDTLDAKLRDGFIRLKGYLRNRIRPQLVLNLTADNNMRVIQRMLNKDLITGMKGRLKTNINIKAQINRETNKYQRDFGYSNISWVNGAFVLPSKDLRADLINVTISGNSNTFQINELNLVRGESDFALSGRLDNAISYMLKDPDNLKGTLSLKTQKLRLNDFIDSTLIPGVSPELYDLQTRITLTAPYQARQAGKLPLTNSVLTLAYFETSSNFFTHIQKLTGNVSGNRNEILLENWQGELGESDIQFNTRLYTDKNLYKREFKLEDLTLEFDFNSRALRAADFFTLMNEFYLPENYRDEELRRFELAGSLKASRPDSIEAYQIPNLEFKVNTLSFRLSSFPVDFKNFKIDLVKRERHATINTLEGQVGRSQFRVQGEVLNMFVPPNETPRDLSGELFVAADRISTQDFMDASQVLDFAPELYNLDTRVQLIVPKQARMRENFSGTRLTLSNFSTQSNFIADIKRITGQILIENRDILLQNWRGQLGESKLNADLAFRDIPPFLKQDKPLKSLNLEYNIQAPRMRASDLFTFRDSFYFADHFEKEELQNLILTGRINAVRNPDLQVQFYIDSLKWDLTLFPMPFRNFKVDLYAQKGEIRLNTFTGQIGSSDFAIEGRTANLAALNGKGGGPPEAEVSIVSNRLDLNELILLNLSEQATSEENQEKMVANEVERPVDAAELDAFNPFELSIPNGTLDLRIDTVFYKQNRLLGIRGTLLTSTDKVVKLDQLRTDLAGGQAILSGQLAFPNPDSATIQLKATVEDADLEKLQNPIQYGDQEYIPGNHFHGVFNTDIDIAARLLPNMALDVSGADGTVDLSFKEGALIEFPPLEMLSDIMGTKDLANVRFDDLQNTLELEDGYIFIPKMDINTTLGAVRITGFQHFDSEIEYLVQIPFGMVSSVGWNFLTGKKRKEDAEPDEIVKMKDGGIKINVRIVGTLDDYTIKLGKGKTFKAIDKAEKKDARKKKKKG